MFGKKLIAVAAAAVFGTALLCGAGIASAHEGREHDQGIDQAGSVETSKKEICPVSGEETDPKTAISHEYKGKVYTLCCTDCLEKFKRDPEKYSGTVKGEALEEPLRHEDHDPEHGNNR